MLRLRFPLVLLMLILSPLVIAGQWESHINALEPATKTELTLPTDSIVGTCLLKAGTYLVQCDRETVYFVLKSSGETMATLACRGPIMKEKSKDTRAVFVKQPSGYVALEKLYMKGNNVEHVF
ncbi:MAG: hypothetical protein KAY59_04985 [Acidobacteria bacterium]|nr:hypothetical protein [Acidobacteriota bacterium]MBP8273761.1 hypothetical protein [Acidobacteriota bacterium]